MGELYRRLNVDVLDERRHFLDELVLFATFPHLQQFHSHHAHHHPVHHPVHHPSTVTATATAAATTAATVTAPVTTATPPATTTAFTATTTPATTATPAVVAPRRSSSGAKSESPDLLSEEEWTRLPQQQQQQRAVAGVGASDITGATSSFAPASSSVQGREATSPPQPQPQPPSPILVSPNNSYAAAKAAMYMKKSASGKSWSSSASASVSSPSFIGVGSTTASEPQAASSAAADHAAVVPNVVVHRPPPPLPNASRLPMVRSFGVADDHPPRSSLWNTVNANDDDNKDNTNDVNDGYDTTTTVHVGNLFEDPMDTEAETEQEALSHDRDPARSSTQPQPPPPPLALLQPPPLPPPPPLVPQKKKFKYFLKKSARPASFVLGVSASDLRTERPSPIATTAIDYDDARRPIRKSSVSSQRWLDSDEEMMMTDDEDVEAVEHADPRAAAPSITQSPAARTLESSLMSRKQLVFDSDDMDQSSDYDGRHDYADDDHDHDDDSGSHQRLSDVDSIDLESEMEEEEGEDDDLRRHPGHSRTAAGNATATFATTTTNPTAGLNNMVFHHHQRSGYEDGSSDISSQDGSQLDEFFFAESPAANKEPSDMEAVLQDTLGEEMAKLLDSTQLQSEQAYESLVWDFVGTRLVWFGVVC